MKRATRSILGSSVVLAIAAGVGLYFWSNQGAQDPDAPKGEEDFTLVEVGAIGRIEVQGKRTFTIERRGGAWWIVQPYEMHADEQKLAGVLRVLKSKASKVFSEEDMPADGISGLRAPLFNLRIVGENASALIQVGLISSFNRQLHMRVEDDRGVRTVLGDSGLLRVLDTEVTRLLSTDALGLPTKKVERFAMTPRAGLTLGEVSAIPYAIGRSKEIVEIQGVVAERGFVVEEPKVDGPDIQTLQAITGAFEVKIARFIKKDAASLAKVGLDDPPWRVKYTTTKKNVENELLVSEPQTLPGADGPRAFITRTNMPFVGEVHPTIYERLFATREQLETKKLLVLDTTAVRAIELVLGGKTERLERTPGGAGEPPGWKVVGAAPRVANTNAVNKLLVSFSLLEGKQREADSAGADLKKYGLGTEKRRTIRFLARADLSLGEMWIGSLVDEDAYAMRKEGAYIARVSADAIAFLPKRLDELL